MSKNNTPKRKRTKQKTRLLAAAEFIKNYTGKNLIKGYSKWFGVDKHRAIKELELAGVEIPEELKKQIIASHKSLVAQRKKRKIKKDEKDVNDINPIESDENFAFIFGYTSGGAAYGLTHEEFEDDFSRINEEDLERYRFF